MMVLFSQLWNDKALTLIPCCCVSLRWVCPEWTKCSTSELGMVPSQVTTLFFFFSFYTSLVRIYLVIYQSSREVKFSTCCGHDRKSYTIPVSHFRRPGVIHWEHVEIVPLLIFIKLEFF